MAVERTVGHTPYSTEYHSRMKSPPEEYDMVMEWEENDMLKERIPPSERTNLVKKASWMSRRGLQHQELNHRSNVEIWGHRWSPPRMRWRWLFYFTKIEASKVSTTHRDIVALLLIIVIVRRGRVIRWRNWRWWRRYIMLCHKRNIPPRHCYRTHNLNSKGRMPQHQVLSYNHHKWSRAIVRTGQQKSPLGAG